MALKTSQLRIIGGRCKRQHIAFIDGAANKYGLRPTPDRLRETLFNWLAPYVHGASVLDVCAGSGALGLESLSRGAQSAVFIEPNKKQAQLLICNAKKLGVVAQSCVYPKKAEQVLPSLLAAHSTGFDVIFLDPPYAANLWIPLLKLVVKHGLLGQQGLLYIEADRPHDALKLAHGLDCDGQLLVEKMTQVGQVWAGLYRVVLD